ncbi:hypothetical protein K438DRAFT_1778016 [Mycena galopus ATCC 62051]|nr:hypothetical protein K438DRAFT_1778016 [Mycena galopus ATCC 62051]
MIPTERYRTLLETNIPPLEAELPVFCSMISAAAAHMAGWHKEGDHRINLTNAGFEAFNRAMTALLPSWNPVFRKADILSLFHAHCSVVSTIRRIPPEILIEIFCWSLPTLTDRLVNLSIEDSPWILTHVSHQWREIAIGTSALWSFIAIDYDVGDDPLPAFPLSMVETQISRARRLKIHFQGSENHDPEPQIKLFKYLASYSSRWEELTILLTTPLLPSVGCLQNHVPSLRRLCVLRRATDSPEPILGFHTAPSLVEVDLFIYNTPTIFPANHLTHYRMCTTWNIHGTVLKEASALQSAWIMVPLMEGPGPWAEDDDFGPITLPALKHILVSHSRLLEYVITPKIESLVVHVIEETSPWLNNALESFSSRCCPKRFVLYGDITGIMASMVVRQMPNITEFGFVLQAMNPYDDQEPDFEQEEEGEITLVESLEYQTMETPDEKEESISGVEDEEDSTSEATITIGALEHLVQGVEVTAESVPQLHTIFLGAAGSCIDYTRLLNFLQAQWKPESSPLKQICIANLGTHPSIAGFDVLRDKGLDITFSTRLEQPCIVIDNWILGDRWATVGY